ncbi:MULTISPECIES: tail fiber assembly protein [Serratia]|uniref:tail fiber assembly protein n=1 Tax=Serratia TaxID=613 RepID=UPI00313DAA5A
MSNFSFSDTDQALWVYHFDSTGVFIGSGLMTVPAGTGLPANTTIVPCKPNDGKTGVWNGASWDYVDDNRGLRYWNKYGVGTVVLSVNDIIPADAIYIEPPKKEAGHVVIYQDDHWQAIPDNTGKKYYDRYGTEYTVPDAWFELAPDCTLEAPPEPKSGYAVYWNGLEWNYLEDFRGQTAYVKESGGAIIVADLGPLAEQYTFDRPTTPYDEWNGKQWVTNAQAQKDQQVKDAMQRRYALRTEADSVIAPLQDAVKFGLATEDEKSQLESWERYRVALMRIDPEHAPDIIWPIKP